jgi:hypothetical protein
MGEECHVVYLLVESRKLLDHTKNKNYSIPRFYADWAVHTSKDSLTPEMKATLEKIYLEVTPLFKNQSVINIESKLMSFVSMTALRKEMSLLFDECKLPDALVKVDKNWAAFQSLLASVLADQPVKNPCAGIRQFTFKPAAKNCFQALIECEMEPGTYPRREFCPQDYHPATSPICRAKHQCPARETSWQNPSQTAPYLRTHG